MSRLQRFLRWLYPAAYEETAKCRACGEVRCKSRMVHDSLYGWFCSEEEFDAYWDGTR